ncbi:MAG: uracil-DNA glycosylase [Eubacteriales bacterium]|nr:uracil-DNA glycosylase [Eubacteriales bacterium]
MDKQHRLEKEYARFEALLREVYPAGDTVMVPGEGSPEARLVLVGEAPGEQETLQRKPFVGKAGQNLSRFLELLELRREDIYITNVVKFRPVKIHPTRGSLSNRPPKREEIGLCYHLLMKELSILAPQVVVTLGNTALRAVTDDGALTIGSAHGALTIGSAHGAPRPLSLPGLETSLFPLYHPASIIYNRALQTTYEEDLHALKRYLEETE